jgi:hypothetical protein
LRRQDGAAISICGSAASVRLIWRRHIEAATTPRPSYKKYIAGQGGGHIRILEIVAAGRRGLKIAVEDAGRGIGDIDRALAGATPGAGIPGCRRLMDEFAILSAGGKGTAVTMVKWLPNG